MAVYYVDIDNTIAKTYGSNYHESVPIAHRIEQINNLFDKGHRIIYLFAKFYEQ